MAESRNDRCKHRIVRIAGRIAVAILALVGLSAIMAALTLWLAARPVLIAASRDAKAASHLCASAYRVPKGYPTALREVQSLDQSRWIVFREACQRHRIGRCDGRSSPPPSLTAGLGWQIFHQSYLSDCDVRALLLRPDAHLGRTLHRLHPGRDPASLSAAELDCVAAVLRFGWTRTAEERGRCTLPKPPAARAAQHAKPAL